MGKLTALSVKSIKDIGLHSDGGGLYLKVQQSKDSNQRNKSWIFRWGSSGKNSIGLGSLRDVSLAEARELATQNHRLTKQGIDPRIERVKIKEAAKAANNIVTFERAAVLYIESRREGWKSKKHAQQWANTLETYANSTIGKLPCSSVTTDHIVKILTPIWTKRNETATRVRGRIENILDWAKASGHRTGENPAAMKGNLNHIFKPISKRRRQKHHKAMPYIQVPSMFTAVEAYPSLSAKAMLFCVLTAARTTEIREATWNEFNLEAQVWTIPKERMKREKEHRIPLSNQAIELLKSISKQDGSDWVFNGKSRTLGKKVPLSNMAMLNFLKNTLDHKTLTVHGFRSSFRDWAGETTDHKREVIEQSLAHQLSDQSEAAYQRGDYMQKRKVLMTDWADYCYSDKQKNTN
jgi:integrase